MVFLLTTYVVKNQLSTKYVRKFFISYLSNDYIISIKLSSKSKQRLYQIKEGTIRFFYHNECTFVSQNMANITVLEMFFLSDGNGMDKDIFFKYIPDIGFQW